MQKKNTVKNTGELKNDLLALLLDHLEAQMGGAKNATGETQDFFRKTYPPENERRFWAPNWWFGKGKSL